MRAAVAALLLGVALSAGAQAADDSLAALVQAKDHDGAVALLAKGADGKSREVDGTTALMWACYNGDADLVERLLKAGADVSAVNDYGASALQVAAVVADPRIIKDLLKAGANPDSPNPEGQTALMVVARSGNVESAKLLLDAGATVNAREQWGDQTALMWAASEAQPEMIKLLIDHHADVNAHGAIRDWQRRVTAEGRPKNENHGGFTPLIYAARVGCIECAKALLKGHADINLPDPDGETALLISMINMHFDFASYLVSAGRGCESLGLLRPDAAVRGDRHGNAAVRRSAGSALRGQDPAAAGGRAAAEGRRQCECAVETAAALSQWRVRSRWRSGAVNRRHAAAGGREVRQQRCGETAAQAITRSWICPTPKGVTPLMAAAGMGHGFNPTRGRYKTDEQAAEGVKLLQAAGASIAGADRDGLTALHAAATHGWDDTVKVLVADGAPLQPTDRLGLHPIDYAAGPSAAGVPGARARAE